ncbi:hypothetical protein EDD86DRAFT_207470 [Gorgonomyces haynaldii]|nr:hypothetical protein EDD86DRAFT_207470 [Gorgonomyces haynaldii]
MKLSDLTTHPIVYKVGNPELSQDDIQHLHLITNSFTVNITRGLLLGTVFGLYFSRKHSLSGRLVSMLGWTTVGTFTGLGLATYKLKDTARPLLQTTLGKRLLVELQDDSYFKPLAKYISNQ